MIIIDNLFLLSLDYKVIYFKPIKDLKVTVNFSNINALVIDTNSTMRQIMVSMLRTMGFKNIIAANSELQCFELITTQNIKLIICGWEEKKLNALGILKKLRSSDKTIQIPFIVVSTIIEQAKIKEAVINGVSEYIVPPVNKQIFENRINRALKVPIRLSATKVVDKINAKRFNPPKNKSDLKVLIVDDVAENIEIIREIIKNKYNVKAAINAKIAMEICLSDSPPDLILLDIMMPEIDGLTLCKELKKNPMTQNIVIIFLSALSQNKDVVKGLSLGAVDYITKPVTPSILLARLNVHTKLIINQRAIQNQIDNLIQHRSISNRYNTLFQHDIKHFVQTGLDALAPLERQSFASKQLCSSVSELKYNIGMSRLLLDKVLVLEGLENNSYKVSKTRKELSYILLPIINIFGFVIKEKKLEQFEKISYDSMISCDELLLSVMFTSLYRNAIEASPCGSKISVESKIINDFFLIKIHNVSVIPDEVVDNFDQLFVTANNATGTGVGVYLAFVIIKKLAGELYFHTSIAHGTTFYIKLPHKITCNK